MSKEKLSDKTEAVRLGRTEAAWLKWFCGESGQNRSKPIRAAVRLLRLLLQGEEDSLQVKFVAKLAIADDDAVAEQKAEIWALLAAKTVRGSHPGKPATRKPGK